MFDDQYGFLSKVKEEVHPLSSVKEFIDFVSLAGTSEFEENVPPGAYFSTNNISMINSTGIEVNGKVFYSYEYLYENFRVNGYVVGFTEEY